MFMQWLQSGYWRATIKGIWHFLPLGVIAGPRKDEASGRLSGWDQCSKFPPACSQWWLKLVASKIYTTYLFEQMESGRQPNHIYLENGHWLMCAEMRQPANNALTINKSLKLAFNNDTMHSPIKSNWCNLQINANSSCRDPDENMKWVVKNTSTTLLHLLH